LTFYEAVIIDPEAKEALNKSSAGDMTATVEGN